uniref:Uncharacterized protein n=2 Tax=Corethron hystrix TaxID=216773 RepID=A0A7S1BHJ5_9STRA|mmetsp:Transcript_25945/g.59730  ORF Transcript_25945/g.59730 Transcript_25945/m.59730 type:complete len:264 (+) Transcript_25945:605-1396(+)
MNNYLALGRAQITTGVPLIAAGSAQFFTESALTAVEKTSNCGSLFTISKNDELGKSFDEIASAEKKRDGKLSSEEKGKLHSDFVGTITALSKFIETQMKIMAQISPNQEIQSFFTKNTTNKSAKDENSKSGDITDSKKLIRFDLNRVSYDDKSSELGNSDETQKAHEQASTEKSEEKICFFEDDNKDQKIVSVDDIESKKHVTLHDDEQQHTLVNDTVKNRELINDQDRKHVCVDIHEGRKECLGEIGLLLYDIAEGCGKARN